MVVVVVVVVVLAGAGGRAPPTHPTPTQSGGSRRTLQLNPPIAHAEPSNLGVRAPPSNLGVAQNPRICGSQSGGIFVGAP